MNLPRRATVGFSLVEVTLALGVAAISLLAIFALLPMGLRTNQNSIEQTSSTAILSSVVADLQSTPLTIPRGNSTTSPQYEINLPANPVGAATSQTVYFSAKGEFFSSLEAASRYRVTITFLPNGPGARTATFVNLNLTWPATASLTNAQGSSQTFLALDRN